MKKTGKARLIRLIEMNNFLAISNLEGVNSAFASARDSADVVLRDRGLRRSTPAQTGDSLLRGAVASARLAGSSSTDQEIQAGDGDLIVQRAIKLSTELLALVPVLKTSPAQAFARCDLLLGGQGRPASPAGAQLLQELIATVLRSDLAAMPKAALMHAEIATQKPFANQDQLLARAIERLVLVVEGVDPAGLIAWELGHQNLAGSYQQNLRDYQTDSGVHRWLLYCAEAYAAAVEASAEMLAS